MAADAITPEVSQRICAHMNDDHAEAVLIRVLGLINYKNLYSLSTNYN